jgi:SAM-dependent methyltransferase
MLYTQRAGYDHAVHFILFITRLGIYPGAGARILDFGCGEGALVYRLREMGLDAHGFDIHDRVKYRHVDDRRFFGFSPGVAQDTADTRTSHEYSIPFDDNSFDIVCSSSVIEHVLELEPVMRECARVVKPGGLVAHFYPSMLGLVESHIHVPLGSFFHPRWWLAFWAWMGVRNQFQTTMQPHEVVEANERYYRTGLRYYTTKQLRETAWRYFRHVNFPNGLISPGHTLRAQLKMMAKALCDPDPYRALALTQQLSVITCEGKRPMHQCALVGPGYAA